MITEAMQRVLGDRVVGICDSPIGLGRRAARALGHDPDRTSLDYVGLNHLGWLRGLSHRRPGRAARPARPTTRLLGAHRGGPALRRRLDPQPGRRSPTSTSTTTTSPATRSPRSAAAAQTRGEFLLDAAARLLRRGRRRPPARPSGSGTGCAGSATPRYMKEARTTRARSATPPTSRAAATRAWPSRIMAAIARDERATMILNVRNGTTLPGLPPEAVVEVPCTVDADGPHPLRRQRRSTGTSSAWCSRSRRSSS